MIDLPFVFLWIDSFYGLLRAGSGSTKEGSVGCKSASDSTEEVTTPLTTVRNRRLPCNGMAINSPFKLFATDGASKSLVMSHQSHR